MKIVSQEEMEAHQKAVYRGMAEGGLIGGTIAATGLTYLQRTHAGFRSLPRSLKTMGAILLIVPAMSIQGERRGLHYEQQQWTDEGYQVMTKQERETEERWKQMTLSQKASDWVSRHEYSFILGGWALSLAVAGGIIWRDKYQTGPQKIVQARMWAQGLTIGVLIAGGALSHSRRQAAAEAGKHGLPDHSWQDVLAQKERQAHEDQQRMRAAA